MEENWKQETTTKIVVPFMYALVSTISYQSLFVRFIICLIISCSDKIQKCTIGEPLCEWTWRLSTSSALEDVSQFKTSPRF